MSTKIYTGFRINTEDLAALSQLLAPFQTAVQVNMLRRTAKFLAERAIGILDRHTLRPTVELDSALPLQSPMSAAKDDMAKRQREIVLTQRRDPDVDLEVKLFCRYHPEIASVVGIVAAEDGGEAYAELLKQPGVTDFAYWNNTDPPDDVSESEWELRGAVWDELYSKSAMAPFEFTVEVPHALHRLSVQECLEHAPSMAKRSGHFAFNELCNQWTKETVAPETLAAQSPSEAVRQYLTFRDLLEVDEVLKARLEALKAAIAEKLVPQEALAGRLVMPMRPDAVGSTPDDTKLPLGE